jgi:hypothetical protein
MTTIHHSEDPMKLANTAIGKVLLGYDVRLDPPILTVSKARPVMPETNQEAVVTLQHIINLFPDEPDVIFAAAVAIADIATEAANNGTIVDPLMGSDFVPPSPATATESSTGPIQVFTDRELSTVLHSLRLLQEIRNNEFIGGCWDHEQHHLADPDSCDHFAEDQPLTNEEIDVLCERLNLA